MALEQIPPLTGYGRLVTWVGVVVEVSDQTKEGWRWSPPMSLPAESTAGNKVRLQSAETLISSLADLVSDQGRQDDGPGTGARQ